MAVLCFVTLVFFAWGLWYLPNVVFLLLPAAVGFNLLFVLHVVAAGLGMWAWSRATGTSAGGTRGWLRGGDSWVGCRNRVVLEGAQAGRRQMR